MAASRLFVGDNPLAAIDASCESLQLLFVIVPKAPGPWSSRIGSASSSDAGNPELVNDGPMPRIMTRLATFPVMMKPPIAALSPVSVRMRVDKLTARVVGVGVAVAVAVAAAVAVAVAVGATVAV